MNNFDKIIFILFVSLGVELITFDSYNILHL